MAAEDDGDGEPHGHGAAPGMPQIKSDSANEDPNVPAGTIRATILDPADRPMPKVQVTLGILQTSVAKGEARRRVVKDTDDQGKVTFDQLETGTGYAYRLSVNRDMATFAVPPLQLPINKGASATLHVYPVVSTVDEAQLGAQAIVYVELKDDRIQIEQVFTVVNLGRNAWVPRNVVLNMPPGFSALTSGQAMSDVGIDPIEKTGGRLRGTFGPGRNVVEFRWQLPYGGDSTIDFDVEMMPRVVVAQVVSPASKQMKLSVEGFPSAEPVQDQQGQRLLATERSIQRKDDPPIRKVHVTLSNLPTEGPAKKIVSALVALIVIGVIAWGVRAQGERKAAPRGKEARARLLEELEELERDHRAGDIGPKTYERARRELVDALALTLATADKPRA